VRELLASLVRATWSKLAVGRRRSSGRLFDFMTSDNESVGSRINVDCEALLTFAEAARYVGKLKRAKAISLQTIWRWCTRGRRGVLLDRVYVGATPCTSKEALQRFFACVTDAISGAPESPSREVYDPLRVRPLGDIDGVLRRAGIIDSSQEEA
jgi:hypothetical protein